MQRWHNELDLMLRRRKIAQQDYWHRDYKGLTQYRKRRPGDCGVAHCGICHYGKWDGKNRQNTRRQAIEDQMD